MAFRYTIDSARRLVEIAFEGTLTQADIGGLREATTGDSRFDPAFDQLIDGRGVTGLDGVGAQTITALAARREGVYVKGARRAFVVATDLGYGLSRMFQSMADLTGDVQVFRDYQAAVAWLGRRPAERGPG